MRLVPTKKKLPFFLFRYGLLAGLAVLGGCVMMTMPGKSHRGPLPPATAEEERSAARLRSDVVMLAGTIGERNTERFDNLRQAAVFVGDRFERLGYGVRRETYSADGRQVENIVAEVKGTTRPDEIVVIGAHYDSPPGSPGANDNASGAAAMLELAYRFRETRPARTLRFVAFVNEEPPYFQTETMGSLVHARRARERGEKIVAMLALETIGYYSDRPGSQKYPPPFRFFFPDTGNFIGFVGNLSSRSLLHDCIKTFRDTTPFPSEGLTAPEFITGIGWSDHWSFWQEGYPGIMITDTAPFRYPHYHEETDTPDRLDYGRMARVVRGVGRVVGELVQ